MNLFDRLVEEALRRHPHLTHLRLVVEKELLHHDILRVLSENNFLESLTFMGGTCLRSCYGGERLSEDLDFTGGFDFTRKSLSAIAQLLISSISEKYGLLVQVSEPTKDKQNVDTWKIKVETRPKQKHLPAQRINIDICAIPSYDRRPTMLLNPYNIDMGTSGLVIQSQSREEIYTDKLLAFALRANRMKYRDVWDILWLHRLGLKPRFDLVSTKLRDRNLSVKPFLKKFDDRRRLLSDKSIEISSEFITEMSRFLPTEQKKNLAQKDFWAFVVYLMEDLMNQMDEAI